MPQETYKVIRHIYDDPYTFVEVEGRLMGESVITAVGFAKRSPEDQPNEQIGYELAVTRAKQKIRRKRQLMKQALRKQAK